MFGGDYSQARDRIAAPMARRSPHGSCTVSDEVDENGNVECNHCGKLWPDDVSGDAGFDAEASREAEFWRTHTREDAWPDETDGTEK